MFKDKLFFFGAQEWVDFFAVSDQYVDGADLAMRQRRLQRAAGSNPFFGSPQIIRDPNTGQPFPGNIIPSGRLSPNGLG